MSGVPGSAEAVLPAETPVLGGVEEATAAAYYTREAARDAQVYWNAIGSARDELASLHGDGVTAVRAKLADRLEPGAAALRRSASTAKTAFDAYAAEVDRIHSEAARIESDVDDALRTIRARSSEIDTVADAIRASGAYAWNVGPPTSMPEPSLGTEFDEFDGVQRRVAVQDLRAMYEQQWRAAAVDWISAIDGVRMAETRWRTLLSERREAEARLVGSLDETSLGRLIEVSGGSWEAMRLSVANGISGELWGVREAWAGARHHPLLEKLLGNASGERVWDAPPDPAIVAGAWKELSDDERATLIREVPWVIGNLPGLPYSVRDEANRRTLEFYFVHYEGLSADSRAALAEVRKILDADSGKPPIQLVALNLDGLVPLVAVGYGDLDAAKHMTWEVPGMNNDAHQALSGWDTASRNLYAQQAALLRSSGSGADGVALVAFLGYDTPNAVTVLGPGAARAGAERLAAELDGVHVTRGANVALPTLGVLAHSYGTPVAANALLLVARPVNSFTMIGSAGLDGGRLTDLAELRVDRDGRGRPKIYTAMAEADRLAPLGSRLSGRLQPNPEVADSAALFVGGAYSFSVEGTGRLKPTDGHSIIGHGEQGPGGTNASAGHGYLDRGTHSLHNAAATTIDRLDLVEGALVKTERPLPVPHERIGR